MTRTRTRSTAWTSGPDRARLGRAPAGVAAHLAFTLVELLVVVVVVAIVSATALPRLASLGTIRCAIAGRVIVRDLSYARERAMDTGTRTWVVFRTSSNSYSVLGEDPANSGRSGAITLTDPALTGQPYVRYLGVDEFAGVSLTGAVFDSGAEIGFDWCGKPLNNTSTPLLAAGVVTVTGQSSTATVTVRTGTGLATMP